jgi:2-C-methyl-D-erythritol 4-phosphate cytidylyltransferase
MPADWKPSDEACRYSVVVPAAGSGVRMGAETRKPLLAIEGRPIILHTLTRLHGAPGCEEIVLVVHPQDLDFYRRRWGGALRRHFGVRAIVPGGDTRQESVSRGLGATDPDGEVVLVHDAVRPLVALDVIERVAFRAASCGGAIAAVPAVATIKRVNGNGRIVDTPPRGDLWMAQTPQGFQRDVLHQAHEEAEERGMRGTDDSGLVEALGKEVYVVEDSPENLKITTPEDTAVAAAILQYQKKRGLLAAKIAVPGPELFPPYQDLT